MSYYRRQASTLLALAGVMLFSTQPILAQESNPEPFSAENVTVDLVDLAVFVTDQAGNPVRGLRPEDFQVLEDGRPVTVTNFVAVAPSPSGPRVEATQPTPTPQPNQLTSVIVLVDNVDVRPALRNIALDHCRNFLERLLERPRTRVMVVTGGMSLSVRQTLTDDREAVLATLAKVRSDSVESIGLSGDAALLSQIMSRSSVNPNLGGSSAGSSAGSGAGGSTTAIASTEFGREDALAILDMTRSSARMTYERSRARVAALAHMIGSLGSIPGRKLVLYVGTGLPLRPGEEILRQAEMSFRSGGVASSFSADLEASQYTLAPAFQEMVRAANSGNVTLSAIDVGSDREAEGSSADRFAKQADGTARGMESLGRQQSLQILAYGTGGVSMASSAKLGEGLARLAESLDTYYSLAYPAPEGAEGEYHAISVKIPKGEYRVRHRPGYVHRGMDQRMVDRSMAGLYFDVTSNPLGIALTAQPAVKTDEKTYTVTMVVTVPMGQLMLVPNGDIHEANVSIWVAARDGDERILQGPRQMVPLRVPNHKLLTVLGQTASYSFQLVVREGEQKVAVTVHDDLGQATSTVATTFSVGPPNDPEADVS